MQTHAKEGGEDDWWDTISGYVYSLSKEKLRRVMADHELNIDPGDYDDIEVFKEDVEAELLRRRKK